jgi:hypothetical protein
LPLPAQLDDAAFWRMVTEFSEAGGSFTSENFVSNEPNFQQVLTRLTVATKRGGAYLGVGPEQNFTYVAALEPALAFIIDIRRQNLIQHLMYKAIFEMADDRAVFLSILLSRPRPDGPHESSTAKQLFSTFDRVAPDPELAKTNRAAIKDHLVNGHGFQLNAKDLEVLDHIHQIFERYGPGTRYSSTARTVNSSNSNDNWNLATILATVDDNGANRSFMANEQLFHAVKKMQHANLIVPIVGDLAGDSAMKAIAEYLQDHQLTVTAFYVSNVEQYLFRNNGLRNGGAQRFYENVALLPFDSSSMFIRSSVRGPVVKQLYPGFASFLASMSETINAFNEGRLATMRDALSFSHE